MKTFTAKSVLLGSLVFITLSLCGGSYSLMAQNYDDVLYAPQKKKTTTSQEPQRYIDSTVHNQSTESTETLNNSYQSSQSSEVDEQGNTYITNNYNGNYTNYNEDDYYDYAYAARLKRFYSSSTAVAWDYYDPYYTNLYWYDYNPASWGVSIYLGYSWWAPSYYYTPYYYGYGYPYYAGGFWGNYYYGYWGGGYYAGSCYYNSWDRYSCYYGNPYTYSYGSRTSVGRATTGYDRYATSRTRGMDYSATRNSRSNVGASRDGRTFGERYESRNPSVRTAVGGRSMNATTSRSANTNLDSRSTRTYDAPTSTPSRRNGVDINRGSSSRATSPNANTRSSIGNTKTAPAETYRKPIENINTRTNTPASSEPTQRYTNPNNNTRQSAPTTQPRTNNYQDNSSRSGSSTTPTVNPNRNSGSSTPSRTVSPSSSPSRSSGSTVSPSRSSSPSPSTGTSRSSGSGSSSGSGRSSERKR